MNFFLYTQQHSEVPEYIRVGVDNYSNLSSSSFDPSLPTKVIVHGYNSDMYLKGIQEIRKRTFSVNIAERNLRDFQKVYLCVCFIYHRVLSSRELQRFCNGLGSYCSRTLLSCCSLEHEICWEMWSAIGGKDSGCRVAGHTFNRV